jgi:hypothetical protein
VATTLLILGVVAAIGGAVVFWKASRLIATMLLAFGALSGVTGWLLPVADRVDALKTGGLAAGSVVALYALWLNDRRRRVDEERGLLEHERQELELARAAHDRERAADERFLRAVELLGHETDQVRVGALHALAGLARSRPSYTQDVLDVICSYLRRPFDHPEYVEIRGDGAPRPEQPESDRWRVVRFTAQRLLADLLPHVDTPDAPAYALDLTGASLEYCDLSYRVIGQLRARSMKLYQSNSFHHCVVRGPVWFTNTESWGRLYLHTMEFTDDAYFSRMKVHNTADFKHTVFHQDAKFEDTTFEGRTDFTGTAFQGQADFRTTTFTGTVIPPPSWLVNHRQQLVREA